jgi:hypothetical protein
MPFKVAFVTATGPAVWVWAKGGVAAGAGNVKSTKPTADKGRRLDFIRDCPFDLLFLA